MDAGGEAYNTPNDFTIGLGADGKLFVWGQGAAIVANAPTGKFRDIAAGGLFAAAIREDGTLVAWGLPVIENTPEGKFKAVAAGHDHAIAIREDGTLAGWGTNTGGKAEPPAGVYRAVACTMAHSVAIKPDGSLVQWPQTASTPSGTFKQVSGYWNYFLGLRTDGTLAVWGNAPFAESHMPNGLFKYVDAGRHHGVAIRTDGMLTSFANDNRPDLRYPPGGSLYTIATAGEDYGIALSTTGETVAWGVPSLAARPVRTGKIAQLALGGHTLARFDDGRITGWGAGSRARTPTEPFQHIGASWGVTSSGNLRLWRSTEYPNPVTLTTGLKASALAGESWFVGIKADGTLHLSQSYSIASPPGLFKAVEMNNAFALGLREDGSLARWSGNMYLPVETGTFTQIAVGANHYLALRTDGRIVASGDNSHGQLNVPPGPFKAVAAALNASLALRADGSIVYWGSVPESLRNVPAGGFKKLVVGFHHGFAVRDPHAEDDTYRTPPGETLNVEPADGVLKNDTDSAGATLTSQTQHGTLTFATVGSFTYVPDAGFMGFDTFTYSWFDKADNETEQATVTIEVQPIIERFTINYGAAWIPQDGAAGDTLFGRVTVSGNVPFDTSIKIRPSSSSAVILPSSVPVPAGSGTRTLSFPISTKGPWIVDNSPFLVALELGKQTPGATFLRRVLPRLSSAGLSATTLFETHETTLLIHLDRPAPSGGIYAKGIPVRVYSMGGTSLFKYPNTLYGDTASPPQFSANTNNTNLRGLLAVVPPGQISTTVKIGAMHVGNTQATRQIAVNFRNETLTRSILVRPLIPIDHFINPTTVDTSPSPGATTGTITFNAAVGLVTYGMSGNTPAPLVTNVSLSSNSSVVAVPPVLRIPSGRSEVIYTALCHSVSAPARRLITASRAGVQRTVYVDLVP